MLAAAEGSQQTCRESSRAPDSEVQGTLPGEQAGRVLETRSGTWSKQARLRGSKEARREQCAKQGPPLNPLAFASKPFFMVRAASRAWR